MFNLARLTFSLNMLMFGFAWSRMIALNGIDLIGVISWMTVLCLTVTSLLREPVHQRIGILCGLALTLMTVAPAFAVMIATLVR